MKSRCVVCNKTSKAYVRTVYECHGCGVHICNECGVTWYQDPFDGFDHGDYPPSVCKDCDAHLEPFKQEAVELTKVFDKNLEAIIKRWQRKCKGTRGKDRR